MAKPGAQKPASSTYIGYIGSLIALLVVLASVSVGNVDFQFPAVLLDLFKTQVYPRVIDQARNVTYVGITNDKTDVEHFRNIFYAKDTSGPNRFAPPVPFFPDRDSVIDATSYGAWCPQRLGDPPLPFTSPITNITENCLSVQITRPKGTDSDAKLPVMVWLHGGGHALGSGSDVLYTPDGLIQLSVTNGQPVIFAAINYRFGIFGFAASKPLRAAGDTNVGLRDQRAALAWVKENIASFGGDGNRVTAIGQSVGASDIGLHMTSFGGKKGVPFDRAIMISGAPGLIFDGNRDTVADNTAAVAAQVGCVRDNDSQSAATLQCLREAPFELLTNTSVAMASAAHPPFGEAFFFPTHDGDYIPEYPSKLLRTGQFVKNIPFIASWTNNDGAWYAPPTLATDAELAAALKLWTPFLSDSTINDLLDLYPLLDFERDQTQDAPDGQPPTAQYFRAAQIERDIWFSCPVLDFTWQYVRRSSSKNPAAWLYEFNATRYGPVYEYMGVPFWGVGHLSDIPYLLNIRDLPGGIDSSPDQLALARRTASKILDFVYGKDLPDWKPALFGDGAHDLEKEHPGSLHVEVFGGSNDGSLMEIPVDQGVPDWLAEDREKLFPRCAFINSERMKKETGV